MVLTRKTTSKSFVISVTLGCMLLQGCLPLRHVSPVSEGQGVKENVTMLRNYNFYGAGIYYWPTVDDVDVAGLFVKEHISFELPPGKHTLGVRCFGGWLPIWQHDRIELEINNQSPRFFMLSPFPFGCAEIEEIDAAEAVKRLEGSSRIKTGHISNCEGQSVQADRHYDFCSRNFLP